MNAWSEHQGLSVCLPLNNIDTDQLIPARFMSRPRTQGYGDVLLHDVRQNDNGQPDPNFVLNRHPDASVLVAGQNFGSGSSREAAAYALIDAGIKVVIAPSFADIFSANAVNNGLLPARISEANLAMLYSAIDEQAIPVNVSLNRSVIELKNHVVNFDIDSGSREKLINGWDDIDLTLKHQPIIKAYSDQRYSQNRWAWPDAGDSDV